MNKNHKTIYTAILGCFVLATFFCSCGNTRELTYMQGGFDTAKLSQIKITEPVIRKGDLLSIIVYSDNPAATALYNQSIGMATSMPASTTNGNTNAGGGTGSITGVQQGVTSPSSPGYLVDDDGCIQFQGLGNLHVEGLTKAQLKALLDSKLKDTLLRNPYYTIRFLNYKFTLLGEVQHPGVFNIPGEHISIFDALGLAGDITFYGRRDNVLIIRDSSGVRQYARLNLLKPDVMLSPFYNLQQNDLVIVEPSRKKAVASDQVTTRNITVAATVVSTLAILYSIFK
jgi:polysaccharide export outer membrane protein